MKLMNVLSICLFFLAFNAFSQTDAPVSNRLRDNKAIMFDVSAGYQTMDLKNLNDKITSNGFWGVKNNFYTMGLSAKALLYKKYIIGVESEILLNPVLSHIGGGNPSSIGGLNSRFNVGYNLMQSNRLGFRVEGGLVINMLNLNLSNATTVTKDFNEAISTFNGTSVQSTTPTTYFAVGMDYYTRKHDLNCDAQKTNYKIGFDIGYQLPGKNVWTSGAIDLNGPTISTSGFFIKLKAGNITKRIRKA